MNKKGSFVYPILLVLAIIALLTYTSFKLITLEKKTTTKEIGEIQIKLINYYNYGEKALFYIEQSAKLSQSASIEELYINGGYFKSECGETGGYMLWSKGSKTCFLNKEILTEQFSQIFSNNIKKYASNYKDLDIKNDYKISIDNDNFLIEGNEISIEDENIRYSIMPKIKIKSQDDITRIIEISDRIKNNLNLCQSSITCWKNIDSSFNIQERNKALFFDIDLNNKIGLIDKIPLKIKFALDFNEFNPLFT